VLEDLRRLSEVAEILAWCDAQIDSEGVGGIAVDAPTLIPNATGMRPADREAHQRFGRYHAGCYPANRGLACAPRLLAFGESLTARGFAHAPAIAPRQPQRFQIEVFPHAAMVHLFELPRILKYKKGRIAERRVELAKLRRYLVEVLPALDPPLDWTRSRPLPPCCSEKIKGPQLKAIEDQFDSVICAYVAAHWWWWGTERTWVLGDHSAYIVVPAPRDRT